MKIRNEIDNILRSVHPKDLTSAEKKQMFVVLESKYETATGRTVHRRTVIQTVKRKGQALLYRKVLVGTIIFGLTGATAYASNGAVPGDFLFPVDRVVESVQLGLVSGDNDARMRVRIAEERLEEVHKIIARHAEGDEEMDTGHDDESREPVERPKLSDEDVRRAGEGLSLALGMLDDAAEDVDEDDEDMRNIIEVFNDRAESIAGSQLSSKVRVRIEEEDDEDDKRVRVRVEEKEEEYDDEEESLKKVQFEVKSGRVRMKHDRDDEEDYDKLEEEAAENDEEESVSKENERQENNAAATILLDRSLDNEKGESNDSDYQKKGRGEQGEGGRN